MSELTPVATSAPSTPYLHAWRHPRAFDAQARCIGRTDLAVDIRRMRRLAAHIRSVAARERLPHIVITSPLTRSRAVGRWLDRFGWQHRIDDALTELDFGRWDGQPWSSLPEEEFRRWEADFVAFQPGGGESVGELLQRVRRFDPGPARIIVTHGGWLSAALWLQRGMPCGQECKPQREPQRKPQRDPQHRPGHALPPERNALPDSASWPPAPAHASHVCLPWPLPGADALLPDRHAKQSNDGCAHR